MAKRYSKFHSNFILRKKHQESTKGTIWERDWVTIGAQHQIEKGKRVFYGDTNFLFTDNTYNSYKKRHNFSKWIAEWNYDEAVENSSPEVNIVTTNWYSNDLRDFAYYGSCVELIKNTIFDIVKWFPGRMTITNNRLFVGEKYADTDYVSEYDLYTKGCILDNPFELDLYRHNYDQQTDENIRRYVYDTYYEYEINGEDIIDYKVNVIDNDCLENITKLCEISILSSHNRLYLIDGYYTFGSVTYVEGTSPYVKHYTYVNEETDAYDRIYPYRYSIFTQPVYIHKDDVDKVYVLVQDESQNNDGEDDGGSDEENTISQKIVLYKENPNDEYKLYGYQDNNGVIISVEDYNKLSSEEQSNYEPRYYLAISAEEYMNYDTDTLVEGTYFVINNLDESENSIEPFFGEIGNIVTLQERPENVTSFVNSLGGVGHILLNNQTRPLYRATLITPIETNQGYIYTEKFYTWPSTNGYIDVSSVLYNEYLDSLIKMATIFDETWCDNLWRNMTHESIRNFDWSYKKDYVEGDEEAFVEGGIRMRDIIHIYGRVMDDLKRYVEGIKMTTVITTDDYNNMPDAEVSDKLEYRGWDVYSTIPVFKTDVNDITQSQSDEEMSNEAQGSTNNSSDDYSTVMLDESFMKTYVQKQHRTINHIDYYQLPPESRSAYEFDYIRVVYDDSEEGPGGTYVEYDASGATLISPQAYKQLNNEEKKTYSLRWQNVIKTNDEYEPLEDEEKALYEPYQYCNKNNPDDVITAYDYEYTRWAEDYAVQYDISNGNSPIVTYCVKKVEEDGTITCAPGTRKLTQEEYSKLRVGKDKYVVCTWRRTDDTIPAANWGYSEYKWYNDTYGFITNEQYRIDCKNIVLTDDEDSIYCYVGNVTVNDESYDMWQIGEDQDPAHKIYTKNGKSFLTEVYHNVGSGDEINLEIISPVVKYYYTGKKEDYYRADGYSPYSIIVDGYGVFPVSTFYPYDYECVTYDNNGELITKSMTMYEFNSVENWQEDYFAFEYFQPEDIDNWVAEANVDGLEKYAWETVKEFKDTEDPAGEKMRPYRFIKKNDSDTVISPQQWYDLPRKSDCTVATYKCSVNDDILITAQDYAENIYEYKRLNVISQSYYETLPQTEKAYFAPYNPREVNNFDRWFNARNYATETMANQDIRFVKELMMMSREMFTSKGTRHGIDMIMAMFGFGADTYTLAEKYHRIDLNGHIFSDEAYSTLKQAATYDTTSIYTDYDEEFEDGTVPMGTTELHGVKYIIPYYSNAKSYAGGEVYFQSRGGWGARPYYDNNSKEYNYMETLSYLRVVESISELLAINARTASKGDIYYVMSLVDMVEYDKNPENESPSHFFYLMDDFNPQLYRSWQNIDMDYDGPDESTMGIMSKKAKYLDGIISTSLGNNPHTGYGKYDVGQRFVEYMKKPFKYYLDNYVMDSEWHKTMDGENATYTLVTTTSEDATCKVKDVTDRIKFGNTDITLAARVERERFVDDFDLKHKTENDHALSPKQYYINDKTLIMTNKINNKYYKQYFFDVIVHYLMQMIPSTTILVLENFDIDNGNA